MMKEGRVGIESRKVPDIWATKFALGFERDEEKTIKTDDDYFAILNEYVGAKKGIDMSEACKRIDGALTNLLWHHIKRLPKRIPLRPKVLAFAGSEMSVNAVAYSTISAAVGNPWVALLLFCMPAGPGNVVVPPLRMLEDLVNGKEVRGVTSNGGVLRTVCKALWENSSSKDVVKEVATEARDHVLRAYRAFALRRVHRRVTKQLTGDAVREESSDVDAEMMN